MSGDDTKICRKIKDETDSIRLQQDLDNMESWCQEWLLKLNPSECKVMHIGHRVQTAVIMSQKRQQQGSWMRRQKRKTWGFISQMTYTVIKAARVPKQLRKLHQSRG